MKDSIRKRIGFSAAGILFGFILVSFFFTCGCVRLISLRYLNDATSAAVDFAELTINADKAKEYFLTRNQSDEYAAALNKLRDYQSRHSDVVRRFSLVSFSNSSGSYIYDTGGEALGTHLEYDEYTASIKPELINGRNTLTHTAADDVRVVYTPIRTVDDMLCGYLITELEPPTDFSIYLCVIVAFAVLIVIGFGFVMWMVGFLNRQLFRPIQKITDAAVYLSGDDSASEGKDASVLLKTKRTDEIGRLSTVLQKIFFDKNTKEEHLSQALYDANHDGMTQHYNKRCYHSMEEGFRSCKPLCVIYFDVNNLKLMNDTLGHENGDYVIKQAADYIREIMGEGDYCFRMGGDEFLLVMTSCSFRAVESLMERLDADAPYILSHEEDSVKCALSYGYAISDENYSYEEALAKAEENMYLKKTELKELLQMPER